MNDETFANTTMGPLWQQVFVLEQHELYGALAGQVRAIRSRLDGGEDLADVLVAETQQVLDSPMTREQIASALVSVMARVAQGEDLLAAGAGTGPLYLSGALPISVRRGGIRFPVRASEPEVDGDRASVSEWRSTGRLLLRRHPMGEPGPRYAGHVLG
jgi:hypothetical protein